MNQNYREKAYINIMFTSVFSAFFLVVMFFFPELPENFKVYIFLPLYLLIMTTMLVNSVVTCKKLKRP